MLKDTQYTSYFYYLWESLYESGAMFNFEGKTTGIKNLQTDVLLKTYVIKPPVELVNNFQSLALKYQKMKCKNDTQNDDLLNQSKILRKMIFSGQATVNS